MLIIYTQLGYELVTKSEQKQKKTKYLQTLGMIKNEQNRKFKAIKIVFPPPHFTLRSFRRNGVSNSALNLI